MKRFTWRVGSWAALAVLLLTISSPLAAAADSTPTTNPNGAFDVVVSPASQDLEVKPGQSVSATIQVRNQGLATEHVKLAVMKFGASGSNGTPELEHVTANDEFAQWISFSQTHFDAEPNVWVPIRATINAPATAAFGYYYAIVFTRDQATTQKGPTNLLASVASLILLDVQAPGAVRHVDIANFSADHNVTEFLPVTFSVRLHNTGNVHVAARGNIFISKGGQNLGLIEVNQSEGNVLPNSYRVFTAQWTDGKPVYKPKTANGKTVLDKQGQTETSLVWSNFNLSKLRFGKYHAKLVMVYDAGHGDVEDQAELNFWVIPWRIIFLGLLIVVLVLAGLWTTVLRPLRRRLRKNRGGVTRL